MYFVHQTLLRNGCYSFDHNDKCKHGEPSDIEGADAKAIAVGKPCRRFDGRSWPSGSTVLQT